MDNSLSKLEQPAWKDAFKKATGYQPEELGIHTFEDADKALKQQQQLRNVTAGPTPASYQNYDYCSEGTRNEAIYPTK